jgi:putative FmdB family regulatory protein
MPIYEYTCPDCRTQEELLVPFEERNQQVCSECSRIMVRIISKPGNASWSCSCPTSSGGKPCKP